MSEWKTTFPPNETPVEVQLSDGEIITVRAIYGRDGCLPHWAACDSSAVWSHNRFVRWREKASEK